MGFIHAFSEVCFRREIAKAEKYSKMIFCNAPKFDFPIFLYLVQKITTKTVRRGNIL